MTRTTIGRRTFAALLAAVAAGAAGCGDTLLDHAADPALLAAACSPGLLACGQRCLSCTPPVNAVAACQADACGFTCDAGYHSCGGPGCVQESATSCGPACQDCTGLAPANATAICGAAHACDFECSPGWLRSGTGCERATAVSAGYLHACALLANGKVKCWGANDRGQLGNGTTTDAATPVDVDLGTKAATAIAAGYLHTCAIVNGAAAGEVWCWGDNTVGETGDGSAADLHPTPVKVAGLSGVLALGSGGGVSGTTTPVINGHSCAIASDRSLWCWGRNSSGQLGDGGTSTATTPVAVTVLPKGTLVDEVAIGERHTCARVAGAVSCWGANDTGQVNGVANGAQTNPVTPTPLGTGAVAVAIAAGETHSCALVGTAITCWGSNLMGQVDPGNSSTGVLAPTPASIGTFAPTALACGSLHTCGAETVDNPAKLRCFGASGSGQLGGVPSTNPWVEIDFTGVDPTAQALTAGWAHTCALSQGGGIRCWGANDRGQLGTGAPVSSDPTPAYVSGL